MRIPILLFCFISFLSLPAQESWDIEKCIVYALNHSVNIAQGGITIENAAISTKESKQQQYPSLNASSNLGWNFGRTIDPTSNEFITSTFFSNGYSLNTNVTLYDGGRIKKAIEQNRLLENVASSDLDNIKTTITLDIIRAYFEILFAQDNHSNNQIQLKTISDQIDQMTKMVRAGTRAQFEIYDLEAQKATSEQQLAQSLNRIDLAYLNLKGLMNLPLDFDITITNPKTEQEVVTVIEATTIDEVVQNAMAFLPWARSFDYRIQAAEIQVEIAKSAHLPSVFFGGSLSSNFSNQGRKQDGFILDEFSSDVRINGIPSTLAVDQIIPLFSKSPYFNQLGNNFSYGFGFQTSFPIYNNYSTKASVQRAKLDIESTTLEKEQNLITLRNTMGQILTDARASRRNLNAAERTLTARTIAFENAEKRFNLGAINSYEYLGIQDQLNQSRTDLIIAKYDYLFKAKLLDFYQGYPVSLKN